MVKKSKEVSCLAWLLRISSQVGSYEGISFLAHMICATRTLIFITHSEVPGNNLADGFVIS